MASRHSDADDKTDSRERYRRVLRVVAYNSNEADPGCAVSQTLVSLGGRGGQFDADDLRSTIRAAVENGDLLAWRDAEGRRQLTLATDIETDAALPRLRALATHLVEELQAPSEKIAAVNRAIAEVDDD